MNTYTISDIQNLKNLMDGEGEINTKLGVLSMVALGILPQEVYNFLEATNMTNHIKVDFVGPKDFGIKINIGCPCSSKQSDIIDHIHKITNLVELQFVCKDVVMPPELFQVQTLRRIHTAVNPNNGKEEQLFENFGQLSNLEELGLDMASLEMIPSSIKHLKKLQYLNLERNKLTSLPEEFQYLTHLEKLRVENNQLTAFPEGIFKIEALKYLDASNNKIKVLSDNISALKNLEYLNIGSNQIEVIPESIKKMEKLSFLKVGNNILPSLPNVIFDIPNLTDLNLSGLNLKTLPDDILKLEKLEKLNLDGNPFEKFPEVLFELPNLKSLKVERKDFEGVDIRKAQQKLGDVLTFYNQY